MTPLAGCTANDLSHEHFVDCGRYRKGYRPGCKRGDFRIKSFYHLISSMHRVCFSLLMLSSKKLNEPFIRAFGQSQVARFASLASDAPGTL